MKYILFIWIVTTSGSTEFKTSFDTLQECEIAANNIHILQGRRANLKSVITECRKTNARRKEPTPSTAFRA